MQISKKTVDALIPREAPFDVRDEAIPGFLVRVHPTGRCVYYYAYRNLAKKTQRVSIGVHGQVSAAQARASAKLIAAEVAQGRDPAREKSGRKEAARRDMGPESPLINFICTPYAEWSDQSKKRSKEDLERIKRVFSCFMSRRMAALSYSEFDFFRTKRLRDGFAKATVNKDFALLKAALNKAVEWGYLDENPLRKLKPLKVDNKVTRYLRPDEVVRLRGVLRRRDERLVRAQLSGLRHRAERGADVVELVREGDFGDHITVCVLMLLMTGMRKQELLSLRWCDVSLTSDRPQIHIDAESAKSGVRRHVPLSPRAVEVLSAYKKQLRRMGLLGQFVIQVAGKPIKDIKTAWIGVRREAGLDDVRIHDLRHTFASHLVMDGVDLYVVKELLGHKNIEMTQRYAHLSPGHVAKAVDGMTISGCL